MRNFIQKFRDRFHEKEFSTSKIVMLGFGFGAVVLLIGLNMAVYSVSRSQSQTPAKVHEQADTPEPVINTESELYATTPTISPKLVTSPTKGVFTPTATPTSKPTTPTATSTPGPTATPTPNPDNQAPVSNIFSPQNGGEITYLQDGKACLVLMPPTDNVDTFQNIQTDYAFDGGGWAGFAPSADRAYICNAFENGSSHTVQVRSKDSAGNIESPQTRSFTVRIP